MLGQQLVIPIEKIDSKTQKPFTTFSPSDLSSFPTLAKYLSFFFKDPLYVISSSQEMAMRSLKSEGLSLINYMRETYTIDLQMSEDGIIRFPLKGRWLKGEEYGFLLRHYRTYTQILKFYDCFKGIQPDYVYDSPASKY
jgi:hypothetical protein